VPNKGNKHRVTGRRGDWERRVDEHGEFAGWWRVDVSTGPYRPSWKIHHTGIGAPWIASLTVELVPGWRVRFNFMLEDGAIQLANFEGEGDGDPSVLYRKLGGRALEQQIADEFSQDMFRAILPPDWQTAALRKRRSGRHPVSELELAKLAEAYCHAYDENPHHPAALLAERDDWNMNTLQGRLRKAEERGFLKREGQGKAGGKLTAKARRILKKHEREGAT
jgi:hypothetical protein